jgi:hypothetical protein
MKAGADDASPDERGDEGWDESVLVWNGTVASVPRAYRLAEHGSSSSGQRGREPLERRPARRSRGTDPARPAT